MANRVDLLLTVGESLAVHDGLDLIQEVLKTVRTAPKLGSSPVIRGRKFGKGSRVNGYLLLRSSDGHGVGWCEKNRAFGGECVGCEG